MHVAIIGSRRRSSPSDRAIVAEIVANLPRMASVISGGADGPDTFAAEEARSAGLTVIELQPDLVGVRNRGEAARRYHERNQRVVDLVDEVHALVAADRKGGTEDTIRRASRKGIAVRLY